jgi:hypothetical protein
METLNGKKSLIAGGAAIVVLGLKQLGIDIPADDIVNAIIFLGGLIGFGHKIAKAINR